MSDIFFRELGIPREKHNIHAGSGSHAEQTARILSGVEKILLQEKPDWTVIYGDTNSTLAGALASAQLNIPAAHIEAGMRSFNRLMPEEKNRIVADHLATVNFCSCQKAAANLAAEGLEKTAVIAGDIMFDCVLKFLPAAERRGARPEKFGLEKGGYILLTCHRAENTGPGPEIKEITSAVNALAEESKILFPAHPRFKKLMAERGIEFHRNVIVTAPLGYFDMLSLEKSAALILTDSGGVQKEAFFLETPCVTMRNETEWTETVESGWNILTGAFGEKIISAAKYLMRHKPPEPHSPGPYGDGKSAAKILDKLLVG
jgi:UDP-GlcNAc3NAcA epimerase